MTCPEQCSRIENAFRIDAAHLKNWLKSRLGDTQAAEDVSQAVFLTVWIRAQKTTIENPKALMFKIARDLANNEFKRRARHAVPFSAISLEPDEEMQNEDDICDNPETSIVAKQELAVILDQIDKLPPKNRQAFKLNRFHEKNYEEIAAIMGVSVSSVEKYIMTSLQYLRIAKETGASYGEPS